MIALPLLNDVMCAIKSVGDDAWSLVMKIHAPSVELNEHHVITFNHRANLIFSTKLAMSSSQVHVAGLHFSYNMRKLVVWIVVLLE